VQYLRDVRQDDYWTGVFHVTSGSTLGISGGAGRYEGEFVNNLPQGQGVMYYDDGGQYTGEWLRGKFDGHGLLQRRYGVCASVHVGVRVGVCWRGKGVCRCVGECRVFLRL
jgi:hypothetical protein